MASPHDIGNRVRLRIAGIEFQPNILERTIKAELHIGGKALKELPAIDKGQPLKWSNLMIWWPSYDIDPLCARAGELFIWAATACNFIIKADDTWDRLRRIVDGAASGSGFKGLDSLYLAVIQNSISDQIEEGALNEHMKPEVLKKVVDRLRAVLYEDVHLEGAIRVLHPSFANFALDKNRSSLFWADPVQHNFEFSEGCMLTMERKLRFNICELETFAFTQQRCARHGNKD
ncbi:hypothetical protein B0J17DRAFT_728359 [Rhizoctonia solani]|nr:hypothetical protein B0J17DRAFT_728359 [Rhizoctonia solani]